jgi:hypothetical protein
MGRFLDERRARRCEKYANLEDENLYLCLTVSASSLQVSITMHVKRSLRDFQKRKTAVCCEEPHGCLVMIVKAQNVRLSWDDFA